MNLSLRLKTVASFVKRGSRLADIGTDHGYIPIYLVEKGIISRAIAMDVNKGPIERAKNNIRAAGLEDFIETRISDGLKKLEKNEVDSIIIAGMGGMLIRKILDDKIDIINSVEELIVSPHSDWFTVREVLINNNMEIIDEAIIKDEGKYYLIIKSKFSKTSISKEYDLTTLTYGKILLENKNEILKEFLLKEKDKKEKIIKSLKKGDSEKLKSSLEIIRKALKYYEEC